jgi:hypothetical protein
MNQMFQRAKLKYKESDHFITSQETNVNIKNK